MISTVLLCMGLLFSDGRYIAMQPLTLSHVDGGGKPRVAPYDYVVCTADFHGAPGTVWSVTIWIDGGPIGLPYIVNDGDTFSTQIIALDPHDPGSTHTVVLVAFGSNGYLDTASRSVVHP